jgi:hydrogenase maturation factor
MTEKTSEIIVLLDESGSMELGQGQQAVTGLNTFIAEQKAFFGTPIEGQACPRCNFSLFTFNTEIREIYKNIPIEDVPVFSDYSPNSHTALFDCINIAIQRNKNKENVVLVIITDGQDNSSKHVTLSKIQEKIQIQEKDKNWKIVYLAATPEAFSGSKSLGLNQTRVSDCKRESLAKVMSQLSPAVSAFCRESSQNLRTDLVLNNSNNR